MSQNIRQLVKNRLGIQTILGPADIKGFNP